MLGTGAEERGKEPKSDEWEAAENVGLWGGQRCTFWGAASWFQSRRRFWP